MKTGAKNIPATDSVLLPYQTAWVDDHARLKLMEKGRQIGLSWATAFACVSRCAVRGAKHDQWVSSRDDLQARLFIEDCKAFAKVLDAAAEDLGERVIDQEKHISAYVQHFATGRRIHSMSSNPDAQAGKRGGRVLDEFALHPDPRKLWSIAYPGITWGGSLEVISTHRGSANYFAALVDEARHNGNPKRISLHRITLQDALDQGFLHKLQTKISAGVEESALDESTAQLLAMDEAEYFDFIRSGCVDEESFLQEYMCVPADDAAAFLSYDLIDACAYPANTRWEKTPGDMADDAQGEYYLGIDIGRTRDLTVMWVLERAAGMMFTRHIIEMQNVPFSEQEARMHELMGIPGMRRACIDATGLGMQFAERAAERYGEHRAEAVRFTPAVKEELAYPLRSAFEDGALRIPRRREIEADLRGVRKETTAAGNVRFAGEKTKDGHSDRFWALALALHAGKRGHGPSAIAAPAHEAMGTFDRRDW